MNNGRQWVRGAALLLACFLVAAAAAQDSPASTVAGQGSFTIRRPAERMRLQIVLSARDRDPQAAAAGFTRLENAARAPRPRDVRVRRDEIDASLESGTRPAGEATPRFWQHDTRPPVDTEVCT